MPQFLVTLTDDQTRGLLELAKDLRTYLAGKNRAYRLRQRRAPRPHVAKEADPWIDTLQYVPADQQRVASMELMLDYLGLSKDRVSPVDAGRVAGCMRYLGWDGPKMLRIDGKAVRGYERAPTDSLS